jgi:hypothetical protein
MGHESCLFRLRLLWGGERTNGADGGLVDGDQHQAIARHLF